VTLPELFAALLERYGPQGWWPADSPFEVMVGAVLTQNTAWTNVERAIGNLKAAGALSPEAIVAAPHGQLAEWLRPSGYFNVKAERLRAYCDWYLAQGGFAPLSRCDTDALRRAVLAVRGVGPETADDILLYAFARPVFVVDAYTRRLFARVGLLAGDEGYEGIRAQVEHAFSGSAERTAIFNELHALIVAHAKASCRKRRLCEGCCLAAGCPTGMFDG
jgi:endonuclease-3 related protein